MQYINLTGNWIRGGVTQQMIWIRMMNECNTNSWCTDNRTLLKITKAIENYMTCVSGNQK